MRGEPAGVRPARLDCPDPDGEADGGDLLSQDGQRVAPGNRQVDEVGILIGKDREPQPVAVAERLTPDEEHRSEEISHPREPREGPGLGLPDEAVAGQHALIAKDRLAEQISLGYLLVDSEPGRHAPVIPCFPHIERLVVPEFADQAVGASLGNYP